MRRGTSGCCWRVTQGAVLSPPLTVRFWEILPRRVASSSWTRRTTIARGRSDNSLVLLLGVEKVAGIVRLGTGKGVTDLLAVGAAHRFQVGRPR